MGIFALALDNLLSPMVLFFVLGLVATLLRSDLSIPEAVAKLLALYLLMSIGFRGGVEIAHHGVSATMLGAILAGVLLSFLTPLVAYVILKKTSRLDPLNAAAVAAHYGSISAVTFVAVTGALGRMELPFEGYMVAVAAAMETPAILSGLLLARRHHARSGPGGEVLREVLVNGSVLMLMGSFAIGIATGPKGMATLKPFLVDPFPGFLSLFLLEMGLVAGRGLAEGRRYLSPAIVAFAIGMPLLGAAIAAPLATAIGLSPGGVAVFVTLAASSSYIAVPAAMRMALPEANPAIALTLSLGVTFPFNLTLGIPLYIALAQSLGA
jgi:hypothetical protein